MPNYGYRCDKCGNFKAMRSISERWTALCPACEKECKRDVAFELNAPGNVEIVTDNPRWSRSMGVPPSQLAEFRKRYPNSTYDDNGRLLVKNRKDKLRQAKERGFVELS